MRRKSQSSLEFLTTYAWAFVVIGVAISALYYFGIFDFDKYLPQKCTLPMQFKCLDFSLKPSEINIKLENNLGEVICVKSMEVTNDATPPLSCDPLSLGQGSFPRGSCGADEFEWAQALDKDFSFTSCTDGAYIEDTRVEVKISMVYYALNTPSKPNHSVKGKIDGRVTSS